MPLVDAKEQKNGLQSQLGCANRHARTAALSAEGGIPPERHLVAADVDAQFVKLRARYEAELLS